MYKPLFMDNIHEYSHTRMHDCQRLTLTNTLRFISTVVKG